MTSAVFSRDAAVIQPCKCGWWSGICIRSEKEAAEKKIEQYRHQIQRLENRKKYYEDGERAKRTHRLCNLGGTVERFAPQVKDLTRTEMIELMEYIFGLEEVKRAVSHMAITHISNINRAKEEQNIGTIPSERKTD